MGDEYRECERAQQGIRMVISERRVASASRAPTANGVGRPMKRTSFHACGPGPDFKKISNQVTRRKAIGPKGKGLWPSVNAYERKKRRDARREPDWIFRKLSKKDAR